MQNLPARGFKVTKNLKSNARACKQGLLTVRNISARKRSFGAKLKASFFGIHAKISQSSLSIRPEGARLLYLPPWLSY